MLTWGQIETYALGELGLKAEEFWGMTWREYHLSCKGYIKRWENEWERTRLVVSVIVNANSPKGKGIKPQDVIELSVDKLAAKQRLVRLEANKKKFEELNNGRGRKA